MGLGVMGFEDQMIGMCVGLCWAEGEVKWKVGVLPMVAR